MTDPVPFESFETKELLKEMAERDQRWHAFLGRPTLRCGIYRLEAGSVDGQSPHAEDEVYYVLSGSAQFTADGETVAVTEGTILYVAAHREHRFHDIEEDLDILVFFSNVPVAKPGDDERASGGAEP